MISIICVSNDFEILNACLHKSLNDQKGKFELIIVDNRERAFSSLPAALNSGAKQAHSKYVMFVHQDVCLLNDQWLERAEEMLNCLDKFGAAGVAGMTEKDECIGFLIDKGVLWGSPINTPVKVQTLDEQLLIMSKAEFERIKFDENFRFHSYGADYCLTIQESGLNAYVLPLPVKHNSLTTPILSASNIFQDDNLLKVKHPSKKHIYKTSGEAKQKNEQNLQSLLFIKKHQFKKFNEKTRVFINNKNNNILLDIGTVGYEQPWFNELDFAGYNIGVSEDSSQILISKKLKIHSDYVLASLSNLPFQEKSIEIGICFSLIEYLDKDKAIKSLNEVEKVCKKVVLKVPNNGCPKNPALKTYISTWTSSQLRHLGFSVESFDFSIMGSYKHPALAYYCFRLLQPFKITFYSSQLLAFKK